MQTIRALASHQRNVLRNKISLLPTLMTQGMIISWQPARIFSAIRYAIHVFQLVKPLDRRRQSALVRASTWASAVAQLINIHK
jgi:asparagine N-glycosylation enzyme membrane subunit Stt3